MTAARRGRICRGLLLAVLIVGLVLVVPGAVLAADETGAAVTGSAVAGVIVDTGPADALAGAGPLLLFLVAATLGLLGVLSGPEAMAPAPRATQSRSHEHSR